MNPLSIRLRVAAALIACLAMTGCGINTMHSEQYALKASISDVLAAVKERQEGIDLIAGDLEQARLLDPGVSSSWKSAKEGLSTASDRFWVDTGNEVVAQVDERMQRVEANADTISNLAGVSSADRRLSPAESSALRALVARDGKLADAVETAKRKYNVQVQSYNQIISIAPVKWAEQQITGS